MRNPEILPMKNLEVLPLPLNGKSKKLTVVSLFSGGGGLDLGLEAVGFETLFASDIDPYSAVTLQWARDSHEKTFPELLEQAVILREDIRNLRGSFILEATKKKRGDIDLLAGGPPCQAFSVFGKRRGTADPRGTLVFEYLRVLSQIQPRAFVFENVAGLLTIEKGEVFKKVCSLLREPKNGLRYEVSVLRLNASNFGVPQFRDRIFIVGALNGRRVDLPQPWTVEKVDWSMPNAMAFRTVRRALAGLPKIEASYPANHTGRTHSQRIIDRYASMTFGERDGFTRINKLNPDRPSFTIIVGSDKGGGKGHIHPFEPREVTPRESARIQTFPDFWAFAGSVRHPIRQIGNAVPPLLGSAVGNAIKTAIFDCPPMPLETIVKRLGQQHLFPEFRKPKQTTKDDNQSMRPTRQLRA